MVLLFTVPVTGKIVGTLIFVSVAGGAVTPTHTSDTTFENPSDEIGSCQSNDQDDDDSFHNDVSCFLFRLKLFSFSLLNC